MTIGHLLNNIDCNVPFFIVLDCVQAELFGNGICNDETNIAECGYDGGDCCGNCVVTEHCENCACLAGVLDDGIW